jgi:hypothetical protein
MMHHEHLQSSFVLSTYVYAAESVSRAIDVFRNHCSVSCVSTAEALCVTIVPASGVPHLIVEEFLNYALNLSVEQVLSEV